MKLNNDVYVLALPMPRGDQISYLNLSLIIDPANGPALIDTGLPGQSDAIEQALAEANLHISDLTRIILTHQDIDHVGSLHSLVQTSGARVFAHEIEAPYIDGRQAPRFATPKMLEQRPEMRAIAANFHWTPVDVALQDGAHIDLAGGVQVIFTPGHTPGHLCLYHERTRTLIAGDALTANQGQLQGPNPSATTDLPTASQSIQKLLAFDVQTIICYHGGIVHENTNEQLQHVAQALAQQP